MRHAIHYPPTPGQHGPPLAYFNVMQHELGWEVVHVTPGETPPGVFDYHWWIDYDEDSFDRIDTVWAPPQDGAVTIYVASAADSGDFRPRKALAVDYVFFNQQRAAEEFNTCHARRPHPAIWLPHAAELLVGPDFESEKRYDLVFIGPLQDEPNHNGFTRIDFLDRMFRAFPNFFLGTRHPTKLPHYFRPHPATQYVQARIVPNISRRDDVNLRVFEALGAGAFLLTNRVPALGKLFEDGKHLATYDTISEAVEKARYYLEHHAEREAIARAGYEWVRSRHTYRQRVETIAGSVGIPLAPQT
ncbi:MAG: glycosyltransferase family 1 protein [Anaerolineae bacterium]|nr:glycosyltransferase family 1 protein [Anaerolineae bacterium]